MFNQFPPFLVLWLALLRKQDDTELTGCDLSVTEMNTRRRVTGSSTATSGISVN